MKFKVVNLNVVTKMPMIEFSITFENILTSLC